MIQLKEMLLSIIHIRFSCRETIDDVLHFEFDMSALTVLLKSHAEKNPTASYFNVDILKYHVSPAYRHKNVGLLCISLNHFLFYLDTT